jgi:hypothetical protein
VKGPTGLETSVMEQEGRQIVHLLFYTPERRTPNLDLIEDIVPLYHLPLELRTSRQPVRVYLAPEMTPLEFTYEAGYTQVIVPEVNGHAMVVFEF